MSKLIAHDPLGPLGEEELILRDEFYGRAPKALLRQAAQKAKPTHYKIVCISLYTEDIERLETLVAELKKRGHTKANKSAIIRFALDSVDIEKMPKGY